MANKQTLDEKIAAVMSVISKEEAAVKLRRERLGKLRKDLAKLKSEKERVFTDEIMQIVGECGISSDEKKQELLRLVKNAAVSVQSKTAEPAVSFSDDSLAGKTRTPAGGNTP